MFARLAVTTTAVFMLLIQFLPAANSLEFQDDVLRVGVYENPPLIFLDERGRTVGLYADLLTHIAQQEGWTLNYVQCNLATCLSALEAGTLDLLPAMAYLPDQAARFQFSEETVIMDWGQLITPTSRRINHIFDLHNQILAVVRDDWHYAAFQQLAAEFGLPVRVIPFEHEADVLSQVMAGTVDAGLLSRLSMQYYGMQISLPVGSSLSLDPVNMVFAIPAGHDPALLHTLDSHLRQLKASQNSLFYQSLNRWVNGQRTVLPEWLVWALLTGGSLILIISAGNFVLRRQVNRRTAQLEQRTRELQSLLDASRDLAAIRDLHELLYQIARHALDLLDADEAILMQMIDDQHLRPTLMLGDHTDETLQISIPIGQGLTGTSVANNEPLIINNAQDDPRAMQAPGTPVSDVEHVMVTPLVFREKIIGALLVNRMNKPGFTQDDLRVLIALAQHCSTAIENARLYGELEKHNTSLEQLVTERTGALQIANENLSRLSSLKDEFVSNVSHELRTPIASLKLRRYLLARQPEAAPTHLDVIERETHRLEEIVEDLLYISRLDQGRITLTPRPVDLNALVMEMGGDRAPLATDNGLRLYIQTAEGLPPVLGDPRLISQVLSILLTNALNYTPAGGTITIQTFKQGQNGKAWAGFRVSDTGPGITLEEQARIFDRFYRGRAARESGRHGTGLGLSIAQEIISRHQGQITISSAGIPGEGATFTALLPGAAPHPG